jgi:hypothetical protein
MEQVPRSVEPAQAFFRGTCGGVDLDLFFVRDGRRHGG